MTASDRPASWADPAYVSAVVGVLATGAVVAYTATAAGGPTTEEAVAVLLAVLVPTTIAREVARRWTGRRGKS